MSLFDFKNSPLLRLLSKSPKEAEKEQQLGPEAINYMRSLVATPEWKLYKKFLDIYISAQVKGLLASQGDAEVHRMRGYVQGLLHAAQIPENIVNQDATRIRREQRAGDAATERDDTARAALYATGHFD